MHLRSAGQLQVDGHAVTAAVDRDQRFGDQRLAHRVEQRAEHRAGRKARAVKRQRLKGLHREEAVVAQFRSTSVSSTAVWRTSAWFDGSCPGMLSRARVVRYSPCTTNPRKVSFSWGRTRSAANREPGRSGRPQPERDLDPLRLMTLDLAVPGQPLFVPATPSPGHPDAPLPAARGDRPLDDRFGTPAPRTRSPPMFRRNSRIRGWIAFSAAAISGTAFGAGTVSWSKGNTKSVPVTGSGSTANGRTSFAIRKYSAEL